MWYIILVGGFLFAVRSLQKVQNAEVMLLQPSARLVSETTSLFSIKVYIYIHAEYCWVDLTSGNIG
jgi:hypothetical protein